MKAVNKYYFKIIILTFFVFSLKSSFSQKIGFEGVFQNLNKTDVFFKMRNFEKIHEAESILLYAMPNSSDFVGFHFDGEILHGVEYFETKTSKEEVYQFIENKIQAEQGRLDIFNSQKWFIYDNLNYGFRYDYLEGNGIHFFVTLCTTKI